MTGLAFDDAPVIKLEGYPVINDVASRTFASEMVRVGIVGIKEDGVEIAGVEIVGRQLVATAAFSWRIGILPPLVASFAFNLGMSAAEGVEAVVYTST